MNKYQEAIMLVREMLNAAEPNVMNHLAANRKLDHELQELVDKATPKPVNKKRAIMSLLKTHILLHTGHCPICDKAVSHSSCVEKDGLFCNDCGQALDWGDNETT